MPKNLIPFDYLYERKSKIIIDYVPERDDYLEWKKDLAKQWNNFPYGHYVSMIDRIYTTEDKYFKRKTQYRNDDKPSKITNGGDREWTNLEGKLHRDFHRPAMIKLNGYKRWFYNGKEYRPPFEVLFTCIDYDENFVNFFHLYLLGSYTIYECQKMILEYDPSLLTKFNKLDPDIKEEYGGLLDLSEINL